MTNGKDLAISKEKELTQKVSDKGLEATQKTIGKAQDLATTKVEQIARNGVLAIILLAILAPISFRLSPQKEKINTLTSNLEVKRVLHERQETRRRPISYHFE